jgi:fimbrial isopeptide formation D2 family protein
VTWNGAIPAGGSVTITITASINAVAAGTSVTNQGIVHYDADGNGTNETTLPTDDPGVPGSADATVFVVNPLPVPSLTATKSVSGTFEPGKTVTYTIVIANHGAGAQADNPGDEFVDVLPAELTLIGATATSGTALATIATRTVTWNGAIPAGGSVTITITANINTATAGTSISNQATVHYDADGNGTNETSLPTDDPSVPGSADATVFVIKPPLTPAPLDPIALFALALMFAFVATAKRR